MASCCFHRDGSSVAVAYACRHQRESAPTSVSTCSPSSPGPSRGRRGGCTGRTSGFPRTAPTLAMRCMQRGSVRPQSAWRSRVPAVADGPAPPSRASPFSTACPLPKRSRTSASTGTRGQSRLLGNGDTSLALLDRGGGAGNRLGYRVVADSTSMRVGANGNCPRTREDDRHTGRVASVCVGQLHAARVLGRPDPQLRSVAAGGYAGWTLRPDRMDRFVLPAHTSTSIFATDGGACIAYWPGRNVGRIPPEALTPRCVLSSYHAGLAGVSNPGPVRCGDRPGRVVHRT